MDRFLIQTINTEIVHDFAFHLKEAIKYNNWYYNEKQYEYIMCECYNIHDDDIERYKNYIPIGSLEFVLGYYELFHNIKNITPINIPKDLSKKEYLQRNIFRANYKNNINSENNKEYFVKDVSGFKKFTDIMKFKNIPLEENLLVSDLIDIRSEWRGFVYNKKLLDIKNYSGDFAIYPDINKVNRMIKNYKNSPKVYTIDVAITEEGETVLIEVHQFFSCGLYGFNDYRVLPQMFISTHKEIITNNN